MGVFHLILQKVCRVDPMVTINIARPRPIAITRPMGIMNKRFMLAL